MGTDYRLFTDTAYLELDTLGVALWTRLVPDDGTRTVTQEVLREFGRDGVYHGIWNFVRDKGDWKALLLSEHQDDFWEVEGREAFSVFSRKGHSKRLGYGPATRL